MCLCVFYVQFIPRAQGGVGIDLSLPALCSDGCSCPSDTSCCDASAGDIGVCGIHEPLDDSSAVGDASQGVSEAGAVVTAAPKDMRGAALCPCAGAYGPVCDQRGRLVKCELENRPLVECGINCACPIECGNRFVQRNSHGAFGMEIMRLSGKGWGVKCLVPVPATSFVCEYAGLVVSERTARRREKERRDGEQNFIVVLREHRSDGVVLLTHFDATDAGNASRFFNHSCDPNMTARAVRMGSIIPHLAFFSARDIDAGEELTFSYGEVTSMSDRGLSSSPAPRIKCLCGSRKCQGYLPFDSTAMLG